MFGKVFRIAALAATSVSMLCACEQKNLSLQIQTQAGVIEGIELENGVKAFLGVPFAEAPVGELRWQAPQQKESWDGVLETKAFANDPMQPDLFGDMNFRGPAKSEDCLYLNVWTPADSEDDKLPVMFWIHGGGLSSGYGQKGRFA